MKIIIVQSIPKSCTRFWITSYMKVIIITYCFHTLHMIGHIILILSHCILFIDIVTSRETTDENWRRCTLTLALLKCEQYSVQTASYRGYIGLGCCLSWAVVLQAFYSTCRGEIFSAVVPFWVNKRCEVEDTPSIYRLWCLGHTLGLYSSVSESGIYLTKWASWSWGLTTTEDCTRLNGVKYTVVARLILQNQLIWAFKKYCIFCLLPLIFHRCNGLLFIARKVSFFVGWADFLAKSEFHRNFLVNGTRALPSALFSSTLHTGLMHPSV